jgi:hypothetical protein
MANRIWCSPIYRAWRKGHFVLLACAEQLDDLRATLQ